MADRLVSDGYAAAGYVQVNIDDCWMAKTRDTAGQLVSDPKRFPNGIKGLADYIHSKALKLGVYEDCGTKTCAGYPGSWGHIETDANTLAKWNVDMVKFDGCNSNPHDMNIAYPAMSSALNATGRKIIYSFAFEWPDYLRMKLITPNYTAVATTCNLWRSFDDISVSWASIESITNFYGENQDTVIPVNGPGQWNDPDMIVVRNPQLTADEARAQMTLWSMWSAPLLMSNDLRSIPPGHREILLNRKVIAVDQDSLGVMARRVHNRTIAIKLSDVGLNDPDGYSVENLWTGQKLGTLKPSDMIRTEVKPKSATMFKTTVV